LGEAERKNLVERAEQAEDRALTLAEVKVMELEQRLTVATREAKEATDVKGSVNSKLEELTSMTKDGAKRIKELEKEKKLLEQRYSQFEKGKKKWRLETK